MSEQLAMAAVVLAGGRAHRFDGVDKIALPVGGRTLLDRTLDAVHWAEPSVVVGPFRRTSRSVRWTRETPATAGPVAALAAGLRVVPETVSLVAVLAGDHVHVTANTVRRLAVAVHADPAVTGAVLCDATGRDQWLLGVWRCARLRAAMPAHGAGRSVRSVLSPLCPLRLPAVGSEAFDVDTPEDLRHLRE